MYRCRYGYRCRYRYFQSLGANSSTHSEPIQMHVLGEGLPSMHREVFSHAILQNTENISVKVFWTLHLHVWTISSLRVEMVYDTVSHNQ